jgi:hypothetical protein
LYLGDYQVVDVAKPYAEDNYLEIELALLLGHAHTTCGGRSLNDDAVDTSLTFVVTAGNGPRISDRVGQATVRASDSFPYLAPPNPKPAVAGRVLLPSKLADQLAFLEEAFAAAAAPARLAASGRDGRAQASPLASAPRLPLGAGPHARRLSRRPASGSERQQRRNGGGEKGQGHASSPRPQRTVKMPFMPAEACPGTVQE